MTKAAKKVIFKVLLFSLPMLILIAIYLAFDPFKVLYHYDNYMEKDQYFTPNRDFVSMEVFLNNYPKYKYDSFIFGGSKSLFYEAADWQPYLRTEPEKIFHFDASRESIYGIRQKINYLDKVKVNLKYCLLVLDYLTLKTTANSESILYSKHYILTGENKFKFQFLFFKAFLEQRFLFAYLDIRITHKYKPYMEKVLSKNTWTYSPVNNEMKRPALEEAIRNGTYYTRLMKAFKRKDTLTKVSSPVIDTIQLNYLNDIKSVFERDSTSYKIIISPIYDQVYFNPADVKKLKAIFGDDNVFDFSGKNKFTDDYHNYYDRSHYRPVVSREILKIIYAEHP